MANRPIIEIDVADSAFQRFVALFDEYQAKLQEQPEVWAKINDAMSATGKTLESGAVSGKDALAIAAAQAGIIAESLREATKAQHDFGRATSKSGKGMESLAKSAQKAGSAIRTIAGGIAGIAAGLGLGALLGGLGIGELTDATFSRLRSAGQLGIGTGQLASFSVNAQQFLTPSAIAAAANAKNDLGSVAQLGVLGINPGQRTALSAPSLAFAMLQKAAAAYLTNPSMAKQLPAVQAYLGLGGNLGDVRNAAMHPHAFAAAQANYRADIQALAISRAEAQAWSNLKVKMDLAGQTIQTALINALGPLAPKIQALATDIAGFITTFVNSKDFAVVVKDIEQGMKALSHFLDTTPWGAIGADIKALGADVIAGLRLLNLIPGANGKKPETWQKRLSDWFWGRGQGHGIKLSALPGDFGHFIGQEIGHPINSAIGGAIHAIVGVSTKYGVDPILALATAMHESRLNPHAVGDNGSSFGVFQLHRGGELGALTPGQAFNAKTNASVALREFRAVQHLSAAALLNRFSRQIRNDPTDRNATHAEIMRLMGTPGEVAAVAQRPGDPLGYARAVNKNYAAIAAKLAAKKHATTPVHITITNHTSANVFRSANAAAQR